MEFFSSLVSKIKNESHQTICGVRDLACTARSKTSANKVKHAVTVDFNLLTWSAATFIYTRWLLLHLDR